MIRVFQTTLLLVLATATISGCNSSSTGEDTAALTGSTAGSYLAKSEPEGAQPVGDVRQQASDGDKVVVVGHIGGSPNPFVDGIAAFTIVDPKVPYCQPDEGCPTPWDYCCKQDQVKDNIATVKVLDGKGNPVMQGAQTLLGVKELAMVVVKGVAERDEQGNLTVAASEIFIRK